LENRP